MRLDLYLKAARLVPRRGGASELCREGRVELDGKPAKAGRTVRAGNRIRIRTPGRELLVEVTALPERKSVSKDEARTLYTVLEEKRFDIWGREVGKR